MWILNLFITIVINVIKVTFVINITKDIMSTSTTKAYTRLLNVVTREMSEIYTSGLASGQSECALKEQIRTAFMAVFKMDLLQATTCTEKVVNECKWQPVTKSDHYIVVDGLFKSGKVSLRPRAKQREFLLFEDACI